MIKKIALILVASFCVSSLAHAAFFDPAQAFYTVKTEHFAIHYEKGLEVAANDLVDISEKVFAILSPKYNWKPAGRTHLVLTDKSDQANGMATVLPANYVLLYLTPPDVDSPLENYKNYLELLVTHEFTHILHIDQHHRLADPFHWVMGKIVAPNGLTPGWMREGIATYEESVKGYGRGNFSYSDMMLRTSIYENKFPKIDQAAGTGVHFPAAERQYIYGVKFWQWLSKNYGEDRISKYAEEYSSGLWLFSFNNKARRVYGKSFYKLWNEWKAELTTQYATLKDQLTREGLTPFEVASKSPDNLSYPTALPTGNGYAYVEYGPDEPAHLVVKKDGEAKATVLNKAVYGQMGFSSDAGKVAFGSISLVEKYNPYSEVYVYDMAKKTQMRVYDKNSPKESMRATDPDFAPFEGGNRWLVMVRSDKGTDNLYTYDLENKEGYYLTQAATYTQFSNPRFSPNGNQIVVSERTSDEQRDIVLYSKTGEKIKKITDDKAIDAHPVWSNDGGSIYFDSDKSGIPNIYRYNVATGTTSRVTNVLSGVYQPSISVDGKTLFVKYFGTLASNISKVSLGSLNAYHSQVQYKNARLDVVDDSSQENTSASIATTAPYSGFGVGNETTLVAETKGTTTPAPSTPTPSNYKNQVDDNPVPQAPVETVAGSKKYSAFPDLLLPRQLMPTFATLDDSFILGFSTGSYDPLYRHAWNAFTTYRSDAAFLGGGFNYAYLRYNPSLFAGYVRYALNWGDLFGTGTNFFEERNQFYLGTSYTFKQHNIALSYFFENRDSFSGLPAGFTLSNLDRYAGIRSVYTFTKYKQYPNSISQEDGPLAKVTMDFTNSALGSAKSNEQVVLTGDFRYYFEMPWANHHVLALRTAGGWVWGDQEFAGSFRFGGPFGEGNLAGYSSRLFPFRGLPGVTFAGDRVLLFSGEYRFPIYTVERGIGTWPVFFQGLHGSVFSDYGDSWVRNGKDGRSFFEDFFLSVGAELKADLVVGYGLPLTARLGYAIVMANRDQIVGLKDSLFGQDIKNGTIYFQFGTSF